MSIMHCIKKDEIKLSEKESIVVETFSEEYNIINEVTYKTEKDSINVGTYCPCDFVDNYGYMLYNNKFIMFVRKNRRDGITTIDKVFDRTLKKENNSLKDRLNKKYNTEFVKKYNLL